MTQTSLTMANFILEGEVEASAIANHRGPHLVQIVARVGVWEGPAVGPHGSVGQPGSPGLLRWNRDSYLVLSPRLCSQEQPSSSQCARSKK